MRWVLVAAGVLSAYVAGSTFLDRPDDLVAIGLWFAAGVLVHDLVIAPVTHLLGARSRAEARQAQVAVDGRGLIWLLWGSLTLLGLPILSARAFATHNSTELDAPTGRALIAISVIAFAVVLRLRHRDAVRMDPAITEPPAESPATEEV